MLIFAFIFIKDFTENSQCARQGSKLLDSIMNENDKDSCPHRSYGSCILPEEIENRKEIEPINKL